VDGSAGGCARESFTPIAARIKNKMNENAEFSFVFAYMRVRGQERPFSKAAKPVNIIRNLRKGVLFVRDASDKKKLCPYCEGKGYFQLLLGGSETCGRCLGTGKAS